MDLLTPGGFEDPRDQYGYTGAVFDQVASGERPATISIAPSARHVGVTRRDTRRPGFESAAEAANREGYPVLVRGAGGGATAADTGTFGFSIIRPASEDGVKSIGRRYDEAASLVLAAFGRLCDPHLQPEVGEVRSEFCPGDHSIRVGGYESGMKLVGIAQRITSRATSVGGIVLVSGENELARVLTRVYSALDLPFRPESVGSLRRAGSGATVPETIRAFSLEAKQRYGAVPVPLDDATMSRARATGGGFVALPSR